MATDQQYMIIDGALHQRQHLDGAYIYQNIHTLEWTPRHTERHVEILRTLALELFGIECDFSAGQIAEQIALLLETERPSRQRSIRVEIRQYASGSYTIECDAPSLYRGYALRSLRPEAATIRIAVPLEAFPTSAAVATCEVADSIARSRDFHTAILMDDSGTICSPASQPIAIVHERRLLLAPAPYSIESEIVERAARKAQIEVERRAISHRDVAQADEVLSISWQGITAMQKVDNKTYMSIVAERLASEMEKL